MFARGARGGVVLKVTRPGAATRIRLVGNS
jgi:hypothetical protein